MQAVKIERVFEHISNLLSMISSDFAFQLSNKISGTIAIFNRNRCRRIRGDVKRGNSKLLVFCFLEPHFAAANKHVTPPTELVWGLIQHSICSFYGPNLFINIGESRTIKHRSCFT